MEKDFHYYLVFSLAAMTEQPKPDIIAYASQFVDDNNEEQFSISGEKVSFPSKIQVSGGHYYPIMTQSLSPKSLDIFVQKYVYVPFHFLPGDDTVEIKGKRNRLNTTPNSENGRTVLTEALKSGDPYRVGIALHTFADTWSHQNFTGLREEWNSVYPWYSIKKQLVPDIGHAEAGHSPDVISEVWTDHRLGKQIVNVDRAFDAVREIYRNLQKSSGKGPNWGDVRLKYLKILKVQNYDDRIKAIVDFTKRETNTDIPKYDEQQWIKAALDKSGDEVVIKDDFEQTHWHQFHLAAKAQFALVLSLISEL
jgi:hypothetical protein